jgi:hypothetical protein
MTSSNGSREVEHLLSDPLDNDTVTPQDELEMTQQRPPEYALETPSSPDDSNVEYTTIAENEPLELSSRLASQTPEIITGTDYTSRPNTVSAPWTLASQTPEIITGTDYTSRPNTVSAPWTLRRASLLGFIAWHIILVVVLEVLYYMSNKHQGLATSGEKTYYLWKYCPTASKFEFCNRR